LGRLVFSNKKEDKKGKKKSFLPPTTHSRELSEASLFGRKLHRKAGSLPTKPVQAGKREKGRKKKGKRKKKKEKEKQTQDKPQLGQHVL
jgi:hypothetical protein